MKKSLVLAMAMAMGVTASAYAANPFSDVPAGHWAYDAVAKLADAGVVEGYGATFGGDKLMTRYEMAQLVAKAMAKGANTDKLAAEFSDELDALGVKIAKLEKKVDNVKITGQIRFDYKDHDASAGDNYSSVGDGHGYATMRTRLFVNGQINNNWSYTGMLQTQRGWTQHTNKDGSDKVDLKRAYLEGRIGGVKVLAGHWNEFFICDTILDDFVDGVYAEYGVGKGKVYGIAGKNTSGCADDNDRLYVAGIAQKIGAVDAAFNYFKVTGDSERNIYNINADWAFAKDFGLTYRYMWTDNRVTDYAAKDGWYAQLNYKGADPAAVGTWGLRARYFDQPSNVWLHPTYDCNHFDGVCNPGSDEGGYEGWGFGASYTFAKNVMLDVDYYDTEGKKDSNVDDKVLYSQLWFFF